MTLLLILFFSSPTLHPQDTGAIKTLERELYPQDRRIIMLIQEEAKRLRLLKEYKERQATLPSCPIEVGYWYNLDCA